MCFAYFRNELTDLTDLSEAQVDLSVDVPVTDDLVS